MMESKRKFFSCKRTALVLFGAALVLAACEQPAGPGGQDPIIPAAKSADAALASLGLSAGDAPVTLDPAFDADVTAYTAVVEDAAVTVAAAPSHDKATVAGAGERALVDGPNTVAVTVTAEDGATKKTYTVTVSRRTVLMQNLVPSAGSLVPAFDKSVVEYSVFVDNSVGSITITPTLKPAYSASAVITNPAASSQTLSVGGNTFTITAAEGSTTETYRITVSRRNGQGALLLSSAAELAQIGTDCWPLSEKYALGADITLADWTPIGKWGPKADDKKPFTGSFDGGGHTITLQGFSAGALLKYGYLGIFGCVKGGSGNPKARLENLTIRSSVNATATALSGQAVGALAGSAENVVIENITLSGSFAYNSRQTLYLGGVVGVLNADAAVKNCSSGMAMDIKPGSGVHADIPPNGNGYNNVGGFVGVFRNGGGIENCHNTADVSAASDVEFAQIFVGGVAGGGWYGMGTEYHGYIMDSSSTGNITGSAKGYWTFAGGIAGTIVGDGGDMADDRNTTRIVRCYATGTVSVAGTNSPYPYVGGIVAYNYYGALVSQCVFDGAVVGASGTQHYTGGIAGYNSRYYDEVNWVNHNSRIEDCRSAGTVTGAGGAGGIVGQNQVETYIRRCYSTAAISGGSGIAGSNGSRETNAITACVALNPSVTNARVVGGASSSLSHNYARSDMQVIRVAGNIWTPNKGADKPDGADCDAKPVQAFFENIGWNFASGTGIWKMGGDGYPRLRWEQ